MISNNLLITYQEHQIIRQLLALGLKKSIKVVYKIRMPNNNTAQYELKGELLHIIITYQEHRKNRL